jgi:Leucine-rich repeat (LRR) protein
MYENQLTRVPSQLPQFALLNSIDLRNNLISNVEANAFNFSTATLTSLSLSSNPISSIQEGAFQGIQFTSIRIKHF